MSAIKPVAAHSHDIPGFLESLLHYLGSCADYFSARLSLLGLEAKDALGNYLKLFLALVVGLVFLVFGYIFFVIAFVFLLQRLTHWDWVYITLGICAMHFAVTALSLFMAWKWLRTSVFPETMDEFKKDKQWLTTKKLGTAHASAN